ncbi:MAG: acyltransferase family protein, partial [Sarcina sp.]
MIRSLQGLRVLAMMGIFLFHAGILLNGTFPVTFFFMLSGFVLYYNYGERVTFFSLKESILWAFKRIKKLYPLHIIAFIMSIFIRIDWIVSFAVNDILLKAFLNIFLLQSLSINHSLSFNGSSWFLSTIFMCYLVSLPLMYGINKLNKIKPIFLILGVMVFKLVLLFIIPKVTEHSGWFFYISPYSRITDVLLGMVLAKFFIVNRNFKLKSNRVNFYELSVLPLFMIMYVAAFFLPKNFLNCFYYAPLFSMIILLFVYEQGFISRFLCKDIFQKVATFSFEFYMVHELMLITFRKVFVTLNYHWLIKSIIIAIPSFFISIS